MKHYDQVFLGVQLTEEGFHAEHYRDLLDDLLDPEATQPSGVSAIQEPSEKDDHVEFEAFSSVVRRLAGGVNESIGAAQAAVDAADRNRHIAAARAKIAELRALADRHPSVQLERLHEVTALVERIERDSG